MALPHRPDRVHSGTASSHDDGVVNRVCVCTVSLSKLKLSLVGHTWSPILSLLTILRCACQLPLWSPQFGMGLIVLRLVERLMVVHPTGVGRQAGFFFMNRGFFGGRGIARPPSSSHPRCVHQQCRCVLRRRKDWHFSLPPHNVKEFSGGGGIGPPPHKSGEYFGGGGTGLFLTMSVRSTTICWLCRSAQSACTEAALSSWKL